MSFEKWLQTRLIAHGHNIRDDGVIGRETTDALAAFQRKSNLRVTGVADNATVSALRADPSGGRNTPASAPPAEIMAPWMAEMHRRMGLHEKKDNAKLSDWLKIGKYLGDPAKLPWCGDAVETAIVKTLPHEVVPNNPFWAQGWASFGEMADPVPGAVGVIRWNASSGHVGFVANYDKQRNRVLLLGGNQSDSINLTWFAMGTSSRGFMAFRWPKTFPFKAYPALTDKGAPEGDLARTR